MNNKKSAQSGLVHLRAALAVVLCFAGACFGWLSLAGSQPSSRPVGHTLTVGQADRNAVIKELSRSTGNNAFVKAPSGQVLVPADKSAPAISRAFAFLAANGDLVGLNDSEKKALQSGSEPETGSTLKAERSASDSLGQNHVRLNQFYRGLPVFGAQLIVHMNDEGITATNGEFVSNLTLSTVPALSSAAAQRNALTQARKSGSGEWTVNKTELAIFPHGLLEGQPVRPVLAYAVDVTGPDGTEQIWLDAQSGLILQRIPRQQTALNRTIYSPQYRSDNPDLFVQRREGDPAHPAPFINNLYDFAGQTYNFYASAFDRDSFNAAGAKMLSVYLINEKCPNAYWDGTSTNYCPIFDADDVVSHEWSHAYTQYTHGLIYAYQSGGLNESYSDIFGESVDLLNNSDGQGGTNNAVPYPNGQRWLVGEDLGQEVQELLLRDMYDPDRLGDPGKVSSPNYACGNGDGGGVHTNSGVPNHAFALVVDGTQFKPAVPEIGQAAGTYNGQTITGIGLTKAAAIYYRAESVYQTPTTTFAQHATALQTSCSDLIGATLKDPNTTSATGATSSAVINAGDCQQVSKAMLATEMSSIPPCNFGPVLNSTPPSLCPGATAFFSEDWESGDDGWTRTSNGYGTGTVDWEDDRSPAVTGPHTIRDFKLTTNLPPGHTGTAMFADDPKVGEPGGGTCAPGGDYSGSFTIDSPSILIPAGVTAPLLVFDHYIAGEAGVDGGQVEISKDNGASWTLVPKTAYVYNAPNNTFNGAFPIDNNTGPNPDEDAWTGFNVGIATVGNWGATVANLAGLVQPGDTIKLRFTWSQDGCNGVEGWYIDNIKLMSCPSLAAPTLATGGDYENPDSNGSFTLTWTRPPGATGPDIIQESRTSCAPLLSDDAENGLTNWTTTTNGTGAQPWKVDNTKPNHPSNTFNVIGVNGLTNLDSYLNYKYPIAIPAAGQTFLNFKDWDVNEGDDNMLVEVSPDSGATWTPVYVHNRSELGTGPTFFATEALFQRSVNLANYGGKTILLRFHYLLGAEDRAGSVPLGWYVDDIEIVNDSWVDVGAVTGTSKTLNRGSGSYCYRVRTTFSLSGQDVPSPFSNVTNVIVAPGITPVVSRKLHGGTWDISLPLSGSPGIECRRGGGANSDQHQVVFQFAQPATFSGATVTPGPGMTAQVDSVVADGNEVAVNLKNVSNAQVVTVTLLNVNDGTGTHHISVPLGVLAGDTNADGFVNSADISQTKSQSGAAVGGNNFREDLTADGFINSGDISLAKSKSGTALPAAGGTSDSTAATTTTTSPATTASPTATNPKVKRPRHRDRANQ